MRVSGLVHSLGKVVCSGYARNTPGTEVRDLMTENTTTELEALEAIRARLAEVAATRCAEHPAYEPDYCPLCGTARVIGGNA